MLSSATYRGDLYDIGYDIPETHAIQKGDTLFYAFYSKEWNGKIELRGLDNGVYKVYDYVNDKMLGTIDGKNPILNASFSKNLLVEVYH